MALCRGDSDVQVSLKVSPGELLLQPSSKARLAGLMCKKLVL